MEVEDRWCYAVRKGRSVGVFGSWKDCKPSVAGYPGAVFKKFKTREEAEDFSKGKSKKKENEDVSWSPTEDERFAEFIVSVPTTPSEKIASQSVAVTIDRHVNAWVYGDPSGMGSVAVWFGEEDPRNSSSIFAWPKPIAKTRVGIAACIRAIGIVLKAVHGKSDPIGLALRTDSKYLCMSLAKWLGAWARAYQFVRVEDTNQDMYIFMSNQLKGCALKISVVRDDETCHGIQQARKLARDSQEKLVVSMV